ncbi:MAG: formyl transferase [Gemmatimonadetes bacterium]|nr:formyl transferase [Gemmatimonadota bacterium]
MRTLLICHHDDALDREGLARWLASFSTLAGIVEIREERSRVTRRIRREIERIGRLRFFDVLAFRWFYRLAFAARDARWAEAQLDRLRAAYAPAPADTPVHVTDSPNDAAAERFIRDVQPDLVIARCKFLLKETVFSIPRDGTFVLHPGVCPEYRNAHGCFWALANDDLERVGVTLLRIDRGVDTGPVFAYFRCEYDELRESHIVIQYRCVLDNLDAIAAKLREIHAGAATPIDTTGRTSRAWGQPWLTRWFRWKRRAAARVR